MHSRDDLVEIYGTELLFADGFDDCIIGVAERCGQNPLVAYDSHLIIESLQTHQDMSREEAVEYFEFNILGAWVGDLTPCFIHPTE